MLRLPSKRAKSLPENKQTIMKTGKSADTEFMAMLPKNPVSLQRLLNYNQHIHYCLHPKVTTNTNAINTTTAALGLYIYNIWRDITDKATGQVVIATLQAQASLN